MSRRSFHSTPLRARLQPSAWPIRRESGLSSLVLDFVGDRYRAGTVERTDLAAIGITTTRASALGYFNRIGVFTLSGNDESPIDHDPVTLQRKGLLLAPGRTNGFRNPRFEGAVVGTPGTFPTYAIASSLGTIAANIVAFGTVNGMPYVDVQYVGTTNATGADLYIPEPSNVIASANGQTWTASFYCALVAGSFANVSNLNIALLKYPGGAVFGSAPNLVSSIDGTMRRFTGATGTINDVSNTHVQPRISTSWANGAAINFTLRYAGIQCEQGPDASPLILPAMAAPAATTRPAASVILAGTPWLNASEGTMVVTARSTVNGGLSTVRVLFGLGNTGVPSFNESLYLEQNATGQLSATVVSGGGVVSQVSVSGLTLTSRYRTAVAWKANDYGLVVNGSAGAPDTSGALPTGMDRLVLGGAPWTPTDNSFNGWIERIEFHPRRMAAAELLQAGGAP